MEVRSRVAVALALAFLGGLPLQGGEEVGFSSPKAREAQKTFQKTAEKLKAEYEAKVRKAREDYAKALDAALKEAKKAKKPDEADRIAKVLAGLKSEEGAEKKGPKKGPKAPEKGPDGITFEGGTGESIEDAVIIKGAGDSVGAVEAENYWLKAHYPRYEKAGQGLITKGEKKYDAIEIKGADGGKKTIHFDITECFGFPEE